MARDGRLKHGATYGALGIALPRRPRRPNKSHLATQVFSRARFRDNGAVCKVLVS